MRSQELSDASNNLNAVKLWRLYSLAQRAEYEYPRCVSTPNVCSFMSQAQSNPIDIKAHKLCNLNCV